MVLFSVYLHINIYNYVFSPWNKNLAEKLDTIDLAILRELQRDGRLTTLELSRRVNLSATPCAARVRRLEKSGHIKGYHARLDPQLLDRGLLVFIQVKLRNTDETALHAFNAAMKDIPDVLECHMVGGGFDYLLKLRVADMAGYRVFLGRVLGGMTSVEGTHTYFVMEEVKETAILPLNRNHTVMD